MQKIFNLLCMFSMGSFCSAADFILYLWICGFVAFVGGGGGWGGICRDILNMGLLWVPLPLDIYIYINMGGIYPAGKLQWHFTCGPDFSHSLWLPFVAAFVVLKGLKWIYTL